MLVVVVFLLKLFKRETSDLNVMFTLINILYLSPAVQGPRNLGLGEALGLSLVGGFANGIISSDFSHL